MLFSMVEIKPRWTNDSVSTHVIVFTQCNLVPIQFRLRVDVGTRRILANTVFFVQVKTKVDHKSMVTHFGLLQFSVLVVCYV